jgi:hypothetical protein
MCRLLLHRRWWLLLLRLLHPRIVPAAESEPHVGHITEVICGSVGIELHRLRLRGWSIANATPTTAASSSESSRAERIVIG